MRPVIENDSNLILNHEKNWYMLDIVYIDFYQKVATP